MSITPVVLVKNDEYWLPYVLEASKRFFSKYVIYDIGSTDSTVKIIKDFVKNNLHLDFYVRLLPHIDPTIQGIFRNSMIAETQSEFYWILDADEIYTEDSYEKIMRSPELFIHNPEKLFGVVKRIEISSNLRQAYGQDKFIPHHRIYHRTAIWNGSHPGEYTTVKQTSKNEITIPDVICYHFHGCDRSTKDFEVPKRIERRKRSTYTPGNLTPIDILQKLPVLNTKFKDYPISPILKDIIDGNKKLQEKIKS